MLSKDSFMQAKYQRKAKPSDTKLIPGENEINIKDVAGENQKLRDRITDLEDLVELKTKVAEDLETERNKLQKMQVSQKKDLEKLHKQVHKLQKQAKHVSNVANPHSLTYLRKDLLKRTLWNASKDRTTLHLNRTPRGVLKCHLT